MKRLLFIVIILSLCSCSNKHKAKRFIKNLDTNCTFLFQDIRKDCADVYYAKDNIFYKYNLETKETATVLSLIENEAAYLYDNSIFGKSDVFYLTSNKEVIQHNLISGEKSCINRDGEKMYTYAGGWNYHLLFFDESNDIINCDKKIIDFDISTMESSFAKFNDIDEELKSQYIPIVVIGNNGLLIILNPYITEDGLDLRQILYYYNFRDSQTGNMEQLCQADNIRYTQIKDKPVLVTEKNYTTAVAYNMDGRIEKEFPTIEGWYQKRGLTSGNIIENSYKHKILCYIANDDDSLISSIRFYYYDGYTGEEVELNSFKNPNGDVIKFVMGSEQMKHIYTRSDDSGLIFYGETDFMNEYTLFLFDFATRTTHVIDRGKSISFSRNRFKVEHHNGTESWYNTNGEASQPERVSRDYFYDMGVEIGNMFNSLF